MMSGRSTGVRKVLHDHLAELRPEKDCSCIPKPIGTFSCTGFLFPQHKTPRRAPAAAAFGFGAARGLGVPGLWVVGGGRELISFASAASGLLRRLIGSRR